MLNILQQRLKTIRNTYQFTVNDAAALCGVGKSAVNYWENGKRIPAINGLYGIATAYGVSIDWLCGMSDEQYTTASVACGEKCYPIDGDVIDELFNFSTAPMTKEECLALEKDINLFVRLRSAIPLNIRADILVLAHHLNILLADYSEEDDSDSTKRDDFGYYLALLKDRLHEALHSSNTSDTP